MIHLVSLTEAELAQLVSVFTQLDLALGMLEVSGVLDEGEGVDLNELCIATFDEHKLRCEEDTSFALESALANGFLEPANLPDGSPSYRLTPEGDAYLRRLLS